MLGVVVATLYCALAASCGVVLRRRLLPSWHGPPALLASTIVAISTAVVVAEALGAVGLFRRFAVVVALAATVGVIWLTTRRGPRPRAGSDGAGRSWDLSLSQAAIAGAALALVLEPFLRRMATVYRRGMLEWDTHWYHAPVAARFAETGDLTELHYVNNSADAFLPFNTELLHALGMVATGRDLLSPSINLGWLVLALLAAWCLGRAWNVAAAALAAVAVVASTPVMIYASAGSVGNDLAGVALLLAAAALLVSARSSHPASSVAVAGLAAGLAVGTKVTLIAPVLALSAVVAIGWVRRRTPGRALAWLGGIALTSGFWYVRNVIVAHNPCPWFELRLGSLTPLPSSTEKPPDCGTTSVASYLTDGDVIRDVFRPALASALGPRWGLLVVLGAVGMVLAFRGDSRSRGLAVVAFVSLAAYIVTPATAGGPDGNPTCFDYNTRFATPALALGLVLFAIASTRWRPPSQLGGLLLLVLLAAVQPFSVSRLAAGLAGAAMGAALVRFRPPAFTTPVAATSAAVAVAALAMGGWFVQDRYFEDRYAAGSLPEPIEQSALRLRDRERLRIAVGGFRAHYALYDVGLTNRVEFPVVSGPHGTLERIATCRAWQEALRAGRYDYVVTYASDGTLPPPEADWTRSYPGATRVLRDGINELFELRESTGVDCPG